MKRFLTVLIMVASLICMLMPAMAEDAGQSEISGTDWLTPEDGYVAVWEGNDLLLKPVDQDNNFLYIPQALESQITCKTNDGSYDDGESIESRYTISSIHLYRIPVAMTEDRYQELRSMMTAKDKKKFSAVYMWFSYGYISEMEDADKLLASFPALVTEELWILRSVVPDNGPITNSIFCTLDDKLADYGYTEADFEQDMADIAAWQAYIQNPHSFITIRFRNAASDMTLTRSRVLQLAAIADTINNNVISYYHPDGEHTPIEELIPETYQVDDTVWHVVEEHESPQHAEIIIIPE